MDVRGGPQRRLGTEESMLSNGSSGEDSGEDSLIFKEIRLVNLKGNQP